MKRTKKKEPTQKTKKPKVVKKQTQFIGSFENISSKYNLLLLIGLILTIGIIAFKKFITADHLFFFKDIGSDSINQIYPSIAHKISLMKEGFISKWSFYKGMGTNYYTGFPVEPYGWFREILNRVGYSLFGESYFINGKFTIIFIFNYLLSGVIFYFYLTTMSIKKYPALIGALILSFSGYMVLGSSWGFSGHIFRAVFLLFAFEQLFVKKRWCFFPFAIIFVSNNLFILWLYSFFLLGYSIFRFSSVDGDNKIVGFFKLAGKMIILGMIGLLMNAVNITRGFMKMYFSPRVAGSASLGSNLQAGENAIDYSEHGSTMILRFFSNDIIGSGSNFQGWVNYFEAPVFYIGILSLLLFPHIFNYLNKKEKIVYGSFLGFWLLTLIFPYLRHAILAFTGDYYRFGFDFFIPFILLFFSIKALNEVDNSFKINYYMLGIIPIILIILLFLPYRFTDFQGNEIKNIIDEDIRNVIIFLIIAYTGFIYLYSKQKFRTVSQFAIIFLLIIELSYFSHKSYDDRIPLMKTEFKKDKAGYKDGTIEAVNFLQKIDQSFFRIEKDYQSGSSEHSSLNDAWVQGYFGTTSYSSFNQLNYIRFQEKIGLIQEGDETASRWSSGFRSQPLLQTFANVKYHLSKDKQPEFLRFGFDSLTRINNISILKNRFNLPLGYTYDKYINYEDFEKLAYYQIQQQSLLNIEREIMISGNLTAGSEVINSLSAVINKNFDSKEIFLKELKNIIGRERTEQFKTIILKHSTVTFKRQIALLNAFVVEKESPIDVNDLAKLSKINHDDSLIVSPENFNFDLYESYINKLRGDTLKIMSFNNSKFEGEISLKKDKMLFLTIPFDKGWKIKVNGKEEKLSRVNFGFTGIFLPKGDHAIELYFVPQYSRLTSGISISSVALFWIFLGLYLYRKRKRT